MNGRIATFIKHFSQLLRQLSKAHLKTGLMAIFLFSILPISLAAAISKNVSAKASLATSKSKAKVLSDPHNKIQKNFRVPKELLPRVSFWFDIYTKYDSRQHVIHHQRYPWIVYKVVDTSTTMNGKGHRWTKWHKAKREVQSAKVKVRKALARLARRRSYKNLKGLESELYNKLKSVPGKRKTVLRLAAKRVRSQLGQKNFFLEAITRSSKYLSHMEQEFKNRGLPVELTRMPFVESSFNERAKSKVGASGIWQIMPRTGRSYAIVSKYIDERNSPIKATTIASKLLSSYFRSLKSWPLAVTAYNNGIGGIKKAIKRSRTRKLHRIISRYHRGSFRFASSNFYSSFLAALHAEKYKGRLFSKEEIKKNPSLHFDVVYLSKPYRTRSLLKLTGLSKQTLVRFNMDLDSSLKKNIRLPRGFELHLPKGSKKHFLKRISGLSKERKQAANL